MNFFHGTNKKFNSLEIGKEGEYENYGDAVYFASNFYSAFDGYGQNTYKIDVDIENVLKIEGNGKRICNLPMQRLIKENNMFLIQNVADNSLLGSSYKTEVFTGVVPTDYVDFYFRSVEQIKSTQIRKKLKQLLGAEKYKLCVGRVGYGTFRGVSVEVAKEIEAIGVKLNICYIRTTRAFDVLVVTDNEILKKAIKFTESIN